MTARDLTKALGGQWHGSYGTARCPAHDDRTPSLSVSERDGKLLVKCHAGCDQADVWAALKDQGLVGCRPEIGDAIARRRPEARPEAPVDDHRAEANSRFAKQIWTDSKLAQRSPVETYLGSRGITIEPPATLRFHPGLKHKPTGLCLPAMVAAVTTWPDRDVAAIHRTFLVADGRKKAPVSHNKMALGRCTGGAVRLAQADNELILAEGIETALSVLQATGRPVWACLSTSGLKAVILPPDVRAVTIAADGDEAGEEAAQDAARRLYLEGRQVKIARPPAGMDWNDVLQLPENVTPLWRRREAVHG